MFGNPYVGGYQQPYYTPPMADNLAQLRAQPQAQTSNLVWVQGAEAAKAYLVGAGQTVALWDSESMTIYLKSVDASGVPSMRILDYKERTGSQQPQAGTTEFVTRKEFMELNARLKSILEPKEDKEDGEPAV